MIPSIPGFGFSSPLPGPGWNTARVARAWAELMHRLGYERYGAQGGDLGAIIGPDLGRVEPSRVVGVHVNAASVGFIPLGPVDEADLDGITEVEKARLARIQHFTTEEFGYNTLQSTRPATVSFGLTDSPVGQLAWIVEKFKALDRGRPRAARGRGRPGPVADQRDAHLAHRHGRLVGEHVLRGNPLGVDLADPVRRAHRRPRLR